MQPEPDPSSDELDVYPMVRRSKEILRLIGKDAKVLFFVHVPKTGGTDLAIKLQDSALYNVFSLDAPETDYRDQVDGFLPEKPIFIRGHIYLLDAWFNLLKPMQHAEIFTILRNPYALHVSMATMIHERSNMDNSSDQSETGPTDQPELLEKKLIEILETNSYHKDYSDIYMRYFSYATENLPLMDRLKVIRLGELDELTKKLLPGHNPRTTTRLNQSKNQLDLHASQLLNSNLLLSLGKLVSKDERAMYKSLQDKANPAWIHSLNLACT